MRVTWELGGDGMCQAELTTESHREEWSLSARNKGAGGWNPVDKRVWEQKDVRTVMGGAC